MYIRIFATYVALFTLTTIVCSCSALESFKKSMTTKGNKAAVIEPQDSQKAATNSVVNTPARSESAEADTPAQTPSPSKPTANPDTYLAKTLQGEWYIIKVGETAVDRDENMPYIFFEPATGNFYANNGCNTLNGSYTLSDDDVITFHDVLSTMQYCPDVEFEHDINVIISDMNPVKLGLSESEVETLVDFTNGHGKTVMQIRRGKLGFLNGHWAVKRIEGLETLDAEADIFFDLNELKLHGNTGCNFFNGSIYLDHRLDNAVDFSNIGSTRMACPNTLQETAILVALEQAATAIHNNDDEAMLLDDSGKLLMTLKRITLSKE